MAIYLIGINDSGDILGINSKEFKLTLDNLQKIEQEKNLFRWGGLAGMLGGMLFILLLVLQIS